MGEMEEENQLFQELRIDDPPQQQQQGQQQQGQQQQGQQQQGQQQQGQQQQRPRGQPQSPRPQEQASPREQARVRGQAQARALPHAGAEQQRRLEELRGSPSEARREEQRDGRLESSPPRQSSTRQQTGPEQRPHPDEQTSARRPPDSRHSTRRASLPRQGQQRSDAVSQEQHDSVRTPPLPPSSRAQQPPTRPPQRRRIQPRSNTTEPVCNPADFLMCQEASLSACKDQLVLLIAAMDALNILSRREAQQIQPPVSRTAWLGLIAFLERRVHLYEGGSANPPIPRSQTSVVRRLIAVLRRCIAGLPADPARETLARRWTQGFCHLAPVDQLASLLGEFEALGVLSHQDVQQIRPPSSGTGWLQLLGRLNTKLDMWEYHDGRPIERGQDSEGLRYTLATMTNERVAMYD